MNNKVAVRVINGRTYAQEQDHSRSDVQFLLLRMMSDRIPIHVFHDDVGQTIRSGAAIEQARNIGMLKMRESLTFAAETGENELGVHARTNQFDSNIRFVLIVVTFRQEDRSHAAAAELANQAIRTDSRSLSNCQLRLVKRDDSVLNFFLNKAAGCGLVTG